MVLILTLEFLSYTWISYVDAEACKYLRIILQQYLFYYLQHLYHFRFLKKKAELFMA